MISPVVNGEMVNAEDGKNLMLVNNTVVTVYVDEETSEIQFYTSRKTISRIW
jgi:hypothetical protein